MFGPEVATERRDLPQGGLPADVVVTSARAGTRLLWVEAVDGAGVVLARGRAVLEFPSSGAGHSLVELAPACERAGAVKGCALSDGTGNTGVCVAGACRVSVCGDAVVDAPNDEACDDGNDNPNDGCDACRTTRWRVQVLTGLGPSGGEPARLELVGPSGFAADARGGLLVADARAGTVSRVTPSGRVSTLSGASEGSVD
ncbi:MAG: DUF4215 domain-containing protein, partial [Deltaproteobacteria bacterium]|nr:DUF4215 domain-containing protein [Deltaproteobacteria bacterium]